mmetsp:Transcript_96822/g.145004  ORF Transcript_96822/g.145004 Transcript_96822/m.145004 type:complete len:536 (-) Transcript_96822:256-1863(-)|eukprot:CAMPEP_0116996506 /NCGR_PEP_ID=MMETSP0472-20121206/285_1 /TAXON_ID=693140 ORGANISM="Tiarina fusus, Strain LIS" /NCGR_SAMPLE_ID=MMETSP0472 /ASSEMBLY_ACC=CAM_ASM_000603 /LENGTH=535 /DNA_ID=CAMNT_0004695141 /DNA_START=401 /DNA_END=2008 /DNA_ORIENTATION=+
MARNAYGLDFLRNEHTLAEDGEPAPVPATPSGVSSAAAWADGDAMAAAVAHKPDLEKQFDVIHFLQAHRSAGCLAPDVIYQRTGIDLIDDEAVATMLQHNPKIRVEHVPDPENPSLMIATYAYQAKYNHVRDRTTLLAQINRCKNGVARRDLEDAYDGVEDDLDGLITAGDVLAINNTEDKDKILFPRGEAFLVELDGIITIPDPKRAGANSTAVNGGGSPVKTSAKPQEVVGDGHSNKADETASMQPPSSQTVKVDCLDTDVDPRRQIRRGEAVQVGGQWFRISSAVKEGPIKDQPARAQAPLSVVSLTDLSKRNEQDGYIRPLNEKTIPTDAPLSKTALENLRKAKEARERLLKLAHGRSGGVASQLLGSHAHASNPTTLAASFGTASVGSRKRPNKSSTTSNASRHQDTMQAKQVASDPFLALYTHARRHGCTKDVREMYLGTRAEVPESEAALKRLLLEHRLLEPGEEMRRPLLKKKANVDNDGKPKKRRYYERKNQRMTNTHLEGTEIGAILLRATEKQKQGEAVGDGGM